MNSKILIILVVMLAFGCTSNQDIGKHQNITEQNKTTELVLLPGSDIAENADRAYISENPFAYIEYKNKTELDKIYHNFEKNGFSGCNAKLWLDKTGRLQRLEFIDLLEPGKNKENIFVRTSNCTGHQAILSGDREKISTWLTTALAENSGITGVYDKNIQIIVTELNYSNRTIDIILNTQSQNISGYPIRNIYDDGKIGNIISTRIALSEYNETPYYQVSIRGSYYPDPEIKIKPRIYLAEAKEKLVVDYNKKAEECKKTYSNAISKIVAPRPDCSLIDKTILLTEDEEKNSSNHRSALVIITKENDELERLEYRLAWNIIMKRNCNNDAYVDAMTGELIAVSDYCLY